MEKEFTITDAVARYEQISQYYHEGWTSEEQAKLDLEKLNEECIKANIPFKADFKSLELFVREEVSEEESSSYAGEWDAGDSSF